MGESGKRKGRTGDGMIKCEECGEFFNPACLSEVFEHMHTGISTDKEYYGEEVKQQEKEKVTG